MPNIKSAKKRVSVNQQKNTRNRSHKSELATTIKKFRAAVTAANLAEAERLFPLTVSAIDSAASKGVIHPNNASNKVSAISLLMRDLRSGKITAPVVELSKKAKAEQAKEEAKKAEKAVKETPKKEGDKEEKPAKKVADKEEKPAKKAATPKAEAEKKPAKKPAAKEKPAEPQKEE